MAWQTFCSLDLNDQCFNFCSTFFGLYWDLRERQLVETAFLYISYCLSVAHFRFHAFGQCSANFIFIASSMLLYKLLLKVIWGLTLLIAAHYNRWLAVTVTKQHFPVRFDSVVSTILPIVLYIEFYQLLKFQIGSQTIYSIYSCS